MLSTAIVTAAPNSASETIVAASGSALPCPYGWFSSAGRIATRNPMRTTNELTTSERDSIASAIRAYEWPSVPASALPAARHTLSAIPTNVERMPRRAGWGAERDVLRSRIFAAMREGCDCAHDPLHSISTSLVYLAILSWGKYGSVFSLTALPVARFHFVPWTC